MTGRCINIHGYGGTFCSFSCPCAVHIKCQRITIGSCNAMVCNQISKFRFFIFELNVSFIFLYSIINWTNNVIRISEMITMTNQ